jgi:CRISPR-associated protein (Cas_Cas02710).
VRDIPVTLLQEDEMLDKIGHLYGKLMFDACIEELKSLEQLSQSRPRRDSAEIWRSLCESYSALDRLNYAESCQRMSRVMGKIAGTREAQPINNILSAQFSVLKQLKVKDVKENELILSDIYHNACRCLIRGAYADALARVWRLLEGGMFYYLRENYGIEPNGLEKSPCLKSNETSSFAHDIVNKLLTEGKKNLSFESSRILLKEALRDEAFCNFLTKKDAKCGRQKEIGGMMEGLRQRRNDSVVAHGVKPVEIGTAQNGLDVAEQFLYFLFPQLDLGQYPFAQENLIMLGQSIRQMI